MSSVCQTPGVLLYEGAIESVASLIQQCRASRVFLVVDEPAYKACGAMPVLDPVLRNIHTTRFSGFQPNPKIEDIQRGVQMFRDAPPDLVVAIGGGTAIDLGKLIALIGNQDASPTDIVTGKVKSSAAALPLIAIPTTAGTGSEATHFAVAYIGTQKYSVADASLIPWQAIVDPRLTTSLPPAITAATGLDALCQAIESIWAVGATDQSVQYAKSAIGQALGHLATSVHAPTPASRMAMCRASHLAGKAINITKTTAPHALSYILTSQYHVPHGFAVAMTLARFLAFNSKVDARSCVDPRGAQSVRIRIAQIVDALGTADVHQACDRFTKLATSIGCPASMADLGITTKERFEEIAASVNVERMSNNPRRIDRPQLVELLMQSGTAS